ncbi:ATP-dependent helicase/deoxyribonuclease subunit B [Lactococcus hodotermopsidis]|uniref:ATP-dependent helicase/deoxyribonuclease subunit B n=1 Tax=Pseudolactococcus hodotermopsidis TaxID=2709157 RepID=A0A6A0BAV7_9LACT|nr:ATP-dependent nuclease subunit B [Lactococcus hodotermopsidis]GFH41591.1 ATP-dependent helicase/deoxyribonuclease subunit B [Lactococcus hodotermopsidis]
MKIIHTDIYGDLTAFLVNEARDLMASAKKIFYIVPSSLSFEKEKEILTRFNAGNDGALFDLTVTRLKQLPWYFDKGQESQLINLSPVGLAMLMRYTLKNLSDEAIPTYRFMRDKQGFIDQLVTLYTELTTSNLTTDDLLLANASQKNQELKVIFDAFNYQLGHFSNDNKLQQFIDKVISDKLTPALQNNVLIIDGYSRFSAEEMTLIDALSSRVSDIIIGVYASKKALSATFIEGNVYQQSVELIWELSQKYTVNLVDKSVNEVDNTFTQVSTLMEKESDFTISDTDNLLNHSGLEIWQVINHKEEIEHVAKQIRQLLYQGVQYKEILVLLGDVTADAILLPEIFKTYEIPFFYAQEKAMKNHPLIVLIETLLAIKSNRYQLNDVLNLLKTQLYTSSNVSLQDVYNFEYYCLQQNIRGRHQFNQPFDKKTAEKVRENLVGKRSPLQVFLESKKQKGSVWLKKCQTFLATGGVKEAIERLYRKAEETGNFEKSAEHLEVWQLLMTVLEEFTAVFGLETLSVTEFLDIIASGIKNATYRLVPSNVDVVQVKAYDLVEPRAAKYVFAIGLTQSNFPKKAHNLSLLSDQERATINEKLRESENFKFIDEPAFINNKKNSFTALQLFNAATEQLILSTPQLYSNEQSDLSQYLQFLIDCGVKPLVKQGVNLVDTLSQIGNYAGLLSNFGEIERQLLSVSDDKNSPFWSSLFRIMLTNSDYHRILSAVETDKLQERYLDKSIISALYPSDLNASVSSFENFYNCEYQYFLTHTLHVRELEKIDLDSRISGSYFHEVFEKVMRDHETTLDNFDFKLTQSLQEVDSKYEPFFKRDATSRYTHSRLQEIVKQTATVLKQTLGNSGINSLAFEQGFGFDKSGLETYQVALKDNKMLKLRGLIDRVDQIFGTLGAVDYKSGDKKFDLQSAYDGTSLQFLTYLDILQKNTGKFDQSQTIWGALYLHLQNPTIALKSLKTVADISEELKKSMKYTGFFNADLATEMKDNFDDIFNLGQFKKDGLPYQNNQNFYSETEISAMIARNEALYQKAGKKLLDGKIEINPIIVKHHVKGCQFCHFKSICGFESDLHMSFGRKIKQKSRDEIKAIIVGGKENA